MRLNPFVYLLPIFALIPSALSASDTLFADGVTFCSNSSSIDVEVFDLKYHKSNGSLGFEFSLMPVATDLNVEVNLYVGAYGMDLINQTINLCDLFSGFICPLPQINLTGECPYD